MAIMSSKVHQVGASRNEWCLCYEIIVRFLSLVLIIQKLWPLHSYLVIFRYPLRPMNSLHPCEIFSHNSYPQRSLIRLRYINHPSHPIHHEQTRRLHRAPRRLSRSKLLALDAVGVEPSGCGVEWGPFKSGMLVRWRTGYRKLCALVYMLVARGPISLLYL